MLRILTRSIRVGTLIMWAGSLIDDVAVDVNALIDAGASFASINSPNHAEAASRARIARAAGAATEVCDGIMESADQATLLIDSHSQFIGPSGDRATDTAAIQAALYATAGKGCVYVLGNYAISKLKFPSHSKLVGLGRVEDTIFDALADGTQLSDAAFAGGAMTIIGSTTLSTANVVGTRTLSIAGLGGGTTTSSGYTQPDVGASVDVPVVSTSGLVSGQRVFISGGGTYTATILSSTSLRLLRIGTIGDVATGSAVATSKLLIPAVLHIRDNVSQSGGIASGAGFNAFSYHVRGVSGVGPYNVTVDRPVQYLFGAGDAIDFYDEQIQSVELENFTITGTVKSRIIEFLTTRKCVLRDLDVRNFSTTTPSDLAVSFDTGGFKNTMERVHVDAGGADAALGFESNEASVAKDCVVRHASALIGIRFNNGVSCLSLDNTVTGCGWGLKGNPETVGNGPARLQIRGGCYDGNGIGIELFKCVDAELHGVSARNNTYNLLIDYGTAKVFGGSQSADGTTTGVYVYTSPSTYGILARNGAVAHLFGVNTSDCVFGLRVEDTAVVHFDGLKHHGVSGIDGNAQQSRISMSGGAVYGRNLDIVMTAGSRAIQTGGSSVLKLSQCRIVGAAAFVGIVAIGGTVHIERSDLSGFSAGNIFQASGGSIVFGEGMPYAQSDVVGGGISNVGTVVLNGATGVPVTVPTGLGLVAGHEHRIVLTLKTSGGTRGKIPTVVAGTNQFTVAGDALDTSTYAWRVI